MATGSPEPEFARGRHLLLAAAGLLHGPLLVALGSRLLGWTRADAWTPELLALYDLLGLSFAATVAWVACEAADTRSGVRVVSARWRQLGLLLGAWCLAQEVYTALAVWSAAPARSWRFETLTRSGEPAWCWLLVSMLAAALAEELVYRALLLRGLEGFMTGPRALVAHALVFELVHAYVYGMGLSGVPFVGGLVLGRAFQRTRSLAVPTLLHAGHNVLVFIWLWLAR